MKIKVNNKLQEIAENNLNIADLIAINKGEVPDMDSNDH